jgi:hypothetical protein
MFPQEDGSSREVTNSGIFYEGTGMQKGLTDPGKGKHLWTIHSVFHVANPGSTETQHMDSENLLAVIGPGCFKCEKQYTPEIDAKPCRGSMNN